MKYDLEIVVPMTSKYPGRLDDFKKYGIFNVGEKAVLVTPIISGENSDKFKKGWAENLDVQPVKFESEDYASNVHKHFLDKETKARWVMRLDDDSCTDVDGLVNDLDRFYDSNQKFYLGASLSEIGLCAMNGAEAIHRKIYRDFFGEMYLKIRHEIECCVVSATGLRHILSDIDARKFMQKRSEALGGNVDVALAFASSISKLWPVDLPFATHLPEVSRFSTFGGYMKHIHMVSRVREGENFGSERCQEWQFLALVKSIEDKKTKRGSAIVEGKKFVMENETELRLYEFGKNGSARIKFDERPYAWIEMDGSICLFGDEHEEWFNMDEEGNLVRRGDEEFILKPFSGLANSRVIY